METSIFLSLQSKSSHLRLNFFKNFGIIVIWKVSFQKFPLLTLKHCADKLFWVDTEWVKSSFLLLAAQLLTFFPAGKLWICKSKKDGGPVYHFVPIPRRQFLPERRLYLFSCLKDTQDRVIIPQESTVANERLIPTLSGGLHIVASTL